MIGKPVDLKIVEVRNSDMDAQLVAENIAQQLEKAHRLPPRHEERPWAAPCAPAPWASRPAFPAVWGGAEIARTEHYHDGTIPLQTLRADIDYGFAEACHHLRPYRP